LAGSKSKGLYITPHKSVTPSSAFTAKGSGNLNPASFSALRSGVSSLVTALPMVSNSTDSGAASTRDELSMKYLVSSAMATACDALPALSIFRPLPS
jgi:hypothetical protein